jgi:hypothetical protein
MVIVVPRLTRYATLRHIPVSLRYAAPLVDNRKYYMSRSDLPPMVGAEPRRNAPSIRYLTKLALRCQSAEELGERLRRRYQRQALRQARATTRNNLLADPE